MKTEEIKRWAANNWKKLRRVAKKLPRPVLIITLTVMAVVFVPVCTYFLAWLLYFYGGTARMPDLLALIQQLTSVPMVAFYVFIMRCFVDSDSDGIPDSIDKDGEKTHGQK